MTSSQPIVAVIYLQGANEETGENIVYASSPSASDVIGMVGAGDPFVVLDKWGQQEMVNPRYVKRVREVVR